MAADGSVTWWMHQLNSGDTDAAQELWQRYYVRLMALARLKLGGLALRAADEEDVVQSAWNAFFQGVQKERFPQLADRHELWSLLVTITARKAIDLRHRANRKKRGGGKVQGESVFLRADHDAAQGGIDQVIGEEPSPAFAAQLSEELALRLRELGDAQLSNVAICKLEGYTNPEIAVRLDCSLSSVERMLRLIRKTWERASRTESRGKEHERP